MNEINKMRCHLVAGVVKVVKVVKVVNYCYFIVFLKTNTFKGWTFAQNQKVTYSSVPHSHK